MTSSPDQWIRDLFAMREDAKAPGLNIVDSHGMWFAPLCTKCNGYHRNESQTKGWVCGHCGAAWDCEDVVFLKGEISTRSRTTGDRVKAITQYRSSGSERRIARQIDLGVRYDQFLQRGGVVAKLYVANCMGWSIRRLVKDGPSYLGDEFQWEFHRVRNAIDSGRRDWIACLAEIGIE